MNNNRKILVATDYSEAASKAEEYAIHLARDYGFTLVFLHVFDAPIGNAIEPFDAEKIDYNPLVYETNKLKKHISNVIKSMKTHAESLNTEYLVREGSAGTQILDEAKESDIEFIIIGTHGVTGFREFFIGTHAWDVIKNSPVPVLAIPLRVEYHPVKNIAFASEYRLGEVSAVKFLLKLANYIHAGVKLVHILNPFIPKVVENNNYQEFSKKLRDSIGDDMPEILELEYDDVSEGLDEYCENAKAHWLVMSPEIPTLLEKIFIPNTSATRKMSFLTAIPLLAIPDYFRHFNESFWGTFDKGREMNV